LARLAASGAATMREASMKKKRKEKRKKRREGQRFCRHAKPLSHCRLCDSEGAGKCPLASTEECHGHHGPIEERVGVERGLSPTAATT